MTYCASQRLQFVSHCGRGGNIRVPVHVRIGLRKPVPLLADEGGGLQILGLRVWFVEGTMHSQYNSS